MRIFITKTDTDLEALSASLLRRPREASAALDRVMALNPQIEDFQRLRAGTMLILPEEADLEAGVGTAVGSEGLDDMVAELSRGMHAVMIRADSRCEEMKSDHAAVAAAMKSTAAKRLVASDPGLKQQLRAAEAQFKIDQKHAAEAQAQLADVQKMALAEFARLQKMLGH